MTYDSLANRTILFGGTNDTSATLSDTWEWDGGVWREITGPGPSGRTSVTMAFDESRGAALLFGGSQSPRRLGDTWEFARPALTLGDLNCDCMTNAFDIEPFVIAVFDPVGYSNAYPDCDIELADTNGDGFIDAFDIEPFIDILLVP
jgi:hypothetical protein